jgi:hypothetical protein
MHRSKLQLFDHLVGAGEHGRRNVDAQRLRGLEVDQEVEFCRQHHRQFRRLLALYNPAGVVARLAVGIASAGAVAHEAAGFDLLAIGEDRWQSVAGQQDDYQSIRDLTANGNATMICSQCYGDGQSAGQTFTPGSPAVATSITFSIVPYIPGSGFISGYWGWPTSVTIGIYQAQNGSLPLPRFHLRPLR